MWGVCFVISVFGGFGIPDTANVRQDRHRIFDERFLYMRSIIKAPGRIRGLGGSRLGGTLNPERPKP